MYAKRIDGVFADLMPGQSVKLSRHNPIFNFEGIIGSLINDYFFPSTSTNDKIFGYFKVAQMRYPNKKYYCETIVDGYIQERTYIELVDCTDDGYVCVENQGLSEVFGAYQNIPLNRLPLGQEVYPSPVKAANHLTDKYCWPTVGAANFYGVNVQAGFNGKINDWAGGATLNANSRVPMLYFRWIFEQITLLTGWSFKGEFFTSEEFKRAVMFNVFSVDDDVNIYFANHLPELTIPELLMNLRRLYNLGLFFNVNLKTITAIFGETILNKATRLDWTAKIEPDSRRRPERANRIQLDWELDQGDNLMKDLPLPTGFDKYVTPETQLGTVFEIKTRLSTLAVTGGYAYVQQIGASPRFNQAGQKFTARIAFWTGVDGSGIPVISPTYGTTTLAMAGAQNIPTKFWASYEKFRSKTASKTVFANLNSADLQRINWHNNDDADYSVFIKGKEYYIASVNIPLPLEGLCELELWEKP